MTLLGQHGQTLDYERGIKLISFAAETADENAPQGAYVWVDSMADSADTDFAHRSLACYRPESLLK